MTWKCTITAPLLRHFPHEGLPHAALKRIDAARNERFSFQVALRADAPVKLRLEAVGPADWDLRVRRVGLVPVAHHNTPVGDDAREVDGLGRIPGYVPDPLFDEQELLLPRGEKHAFWIGVRPAPEAAPGNYRIGVRVIPETGRAAALKLNVRLHDVTLAPRRDFDVTNWFYADALIDWYRTELFDKRFWEVAARYLRNMAEHGQNTLYVPVFTPPLDGVKRPCQLLRVARAGQERYNFDWRDVRRYVRLAREQGIERFEWCHLFTQWGARHAIRVYEGQGSDERPLWAPETGATDAVYRRFLQQYLPALKRFLDAEGLGERSLFHLSDEPHGDEALAAYRAARALLAETAPWMRVMDALSDTSFAREGLADMPVASIGAAHNFVREGLPCWCYYCCNPRAGFLQRLLDTPLPKIAMHGLLFYRWPFKGFLHWGYNYWYASQSRRLIDPYTRQDGERWPSWAYGDTFMVYPGADGPVDSLRWELFGESLQDYALLQTLGVARDDPLLEPLRAMDDFPKDAAWRLKLKATLYARGAAGRSAAR